jgi:putative NADH-flavin reductase
MPKIVFLSSCSLNPLIEANEPKLLVWVAATAFSHAYADLALAEAYLRLHKSWLDVTFITSGALVEDEQKGHVLTMDYVKHFLSYPDLAAGMIEVAETGGYEWKQVGVSPTGKDMKFEYVISSILNPLVSELLSP